MAKSTIGTQKLRGRPKVGQTPIHHIRLPVELTARVDDWVAGQPEPRPARSEAIRKLVEKGLAAEERADPEAAALDLQIAEKKAEIASTPLPAGPSPEAALAVMDKALAKNELVEMKNTRTRRKAAAGKHRKPPV
jgi:Arc/MetJ-type ribon-helix-helix transcriptional regulator